MLKKRKQNSFTLVEVTITIAVLAIAMTCIAGLFMNVQRSWRSQVQESDLIRDGRSAMEFMSNEIRQAISSPLQVTHHGNQLNFYYDPNGDGAYPFIFVQYSLSNSNITRTFRFVPGSSPWQPTQYLTRFVTNNQSGNPLFRWNASNGLLTIELTLNKYNRMYALRTQIRPRN